jgi:hypothetical protein
MEISMKQTRILWSGAALVLFAAACEQGQDPTAPAVDDFDFAAVTVPEVAANNVIACKEGPINFTYNFGVSSSTGQVNFPAGTSFSLVDDECKTVGVATAGGRSVTVTENAPPSGTLFDKVEIYRFVTGTTQSGPPSLIATQFTPTATVFPVGNDFGYVLVYYNVAAPSTGCTLTQGYWKTHNSTFQGGAPTDDTWELIGPAAEGTTFFLSGQSYFDVMWTPVGGNAYYNLAHQYIAAVLNGLSGASVPANVATAISSAETLFNTYTPAQIGALSGNNSLRKQFLALAGTLGSYNEGDLGPGHCD